MTSNDYPYAFSTRPEMLQFVPDTAKKILEVGCGSGGFCQTMQRADREIWGLEMHEETAKKAEQFCSKVLVGDFDTLFPTLPCNYFDCIVFNDVLEHMYAPWDVIRDCKKLLSADGVLVSSIPNFRYIANLITEILYHGEFQYNPAGGILDITHIRFFTSKSICRIFQEQDYQIITHAGIRPCKSWKEKLFIFLSFGLLKDSKYKQFATVAKPIR
jgi:2-polyprenyl-3-methyl-5-hydroxy-6-metoxy-1,4-benzoquinol methylase